MGGAFGALGGDLSAININPAGSAVFNTNQYVLSFSNNEKKINTNFFNSLNSKTSSKFSVNNGGGVWVFENFLAVVILIKFHLELTHKQTIHFIIIFTLKD